MPKHEHMRKRKQYQRHGPKRPLRESLNYPSDYRMVAPPRWQFIMRRPIAVFYAMWMGARDMWSQYPSIRRATPRELLSSLSRIKAQAEQASLNRVNTADALNIAGFRAVRLRR